MFLPRIQKPTCVTAWLAASRAVYDLPHHESHNVVIDVEDPLAETPADRAAIDLLDHYLATFTENEFLVRTVANTIFPQALYEDHGSPEFYDVYRDHVFPRLKRSSRDWGRYFERMIAYPGPEGSTNLLRELVAKMKRHVGSGTVYRNIYELPIYNPAKDAGGSPRGGQCLSFLSFKIDRQRRLHLSAIYRNHYYTEKLLGNLIGLGNLISFVADETGLTCGPLTVLSTHAEVDKGLGLQSDLRHLHQVCAALLEPKQQPVSD
ncbi:hypothetical protein RLEG3_06550 (plasmid) [Rhizobium leguminosarum bv. trifolii WSM1689]|uniref:hypothetical protein n=1 Tax=Rhizobium leguminosarum TaxID=384 RepID=UPI0003E0A3DE|nr:hypothetical protein [Rhizobium leguminosarum]AHF87923.1 hypothetical protein RLEG3_06550 [Rhizobium leguminosarum bv. trifolii WSM1689]